MRPTPGLTVAAAAAAAIALTALVPGVATARAAAHLEGRVVDFEIVLPDETVEVGDTVTWVNRSGQVHTVTDEAGAFDTGAIRAGDRATVTVTAPGTYEVFCRIHPDQMRTTLEVTGTPPPTSTPPPSAPDTDAAAAGTTDPSPITAEQRASDSGRGTRLAYLLAGVLAAVGVVGLLVGRQSR